MAAIQVTAQEGITTIAFNRPEVLNALTREVGEQVLVALRNAVTGGARAIVLTGTGRAFSAGADLAHFSEMMARGPNEVQHVIDRDMREALNPLTQAISESPIPVVCAVNGPCAGGSLGVALAADVVVAARSAYFLVPQVANLGLVPDLGITWELPRKIGRARALGVMLLGDRIPAERAEAWGLIWKCVDDAALMDEALATAQRLARMPAAVVRATRELADAAPRATLADQLEAERHWQIGFLGTQFFRDCVARFLAAPSKAK